MLDIFGGTFSTDGTLACVSHANQTQPNRMYCTQYFRVFESIRRVSVIRLRVGVYLKSVCVCVSLLAPAPRFHVEICNGKACLRVY